METIDVLKTARALANQGYSASACSIGDWPEAAEIYVKANSWTLFRWLPYRWTSRSALVRSFDRAIRKAISGGYK